MKPTGLKSLPIVALTAMLVACGYPGPPKPPSLNLPQPVKDLRATRKGNRVYLDWTLPTENTDSLTIRHFGPTRVCRSTQPSVSESNAIGEVGPPAIPVNKAAPPPKIQQSFIDSLPSTLLTDDALSEIFYAISVLNDRQRSAGISNVVEVPSIVTPPPPADFHADVTAAGVLLKWQPVTAGANSPITRHFYRVYRREFNSTTDTMIGEVPIESSQLVDESFEWEKTYFYRATVVTVVHPAAKPESQFESDDTPPAKVFAHDIFPPSVPTGIQAAFSGAGQQLFIDLIWAPDTEADLAGYNIYRREEGGELKKINSQPVRTPSFRDASVASGHTYLYSVSAIDVRGNESARSSEASETVP